MSATDENPAVTEVSDEQSWQLLASARFGRLAVVIGGGPEIFPINIAAVQDIVYFRSGEGTKLLGAAIGHPVAFKSDRVDDTGAWSVIAKGLPRLVEDRAELDRVEALGLSPWVATVKRHVVAINVGSISGRRFEFGPDPDDDPAASHATD
jgi:nitroimidazol reductase NimA-like FMN-containing flavoprotein (pyridoxamine 5'-phosphate oxidase superfamily)